MVSVLKAGKVKVIDMSGNSCVDCGKPKKSGRGIRCVSCASTHRWSDPNERAKHSARMNNCRSSALDTAARSEAAKKAHRDDPTIRIRQAEATRKAYCDDPSLREKQAEATRKAYCDDPSLRVRQSEEMKKRYEDPVMREKMIRARWPLKRDELTDWGMFA